MADRGISFAGDGSMDVSDKMPQAPKSGSLSSGGPISGGPESNQGMSTSSDSISNGEGMPPKGGNMFKSPVGEW